MSLNPKSLSRLIFLISTATILAALGFEYIGGLEPCPLCLQQRYAYYLVVPVSLLCYFISEDETKWNFFKAGILICGVAMLANTGLGTYHAGAEWGFWPGPESCASGNVDGLTPSLSGPPPVDCTEAAWRLFGISMAGYNAVISLGIFTLASFAGCNPTKCEI